MLFAEHEEGTALAAMLGLQHDEDGTVFGEMLSFSRIQPVFQQILPSATQFSTITSTTSSVSAIKPTKILSSCQSKYAMVRVRTPLTSSPQQLVTTSDFATDFSPVTIKMEGWIDEGTGECIQQVDVVTSPAVQRHLENTGDSTYSQSIRQRQETGGSTTSENERSIICSEFYEVMKEEMNFDEPNFVTIYQGTKPILTKTPLAKDDDDSIELNLIDDKSLVGDNTSYDAASTVMVANGSCFPNLECDESGKNYIC